MTTQSHLNSHTGYAFQIPKGPHDFKTTRGVMWRIGRAADPAWLRFAKTEKGVVCAPPELLAPEPARYSDQISYLESVLRDRGHNLTAKTVSELRQWLNG